MWGMLSEVRSGHVLSMLEHAHEYESIPPVVQAGAWNPVRPLAPSTLLWPMAESHHPRAFSVLLSGYPRGLRLGVLALVIRCGK